MESGMKLPNAQTDTVVAGTGALAISIPSRFFGRYRQCLKVFSKSLLWLEKIVNHKIRYDLVVFVIYVSFW